MEELLKNSIALQSCCYFGNELLTRQQFFSNFQGCVLGSEDGLHVVSMKPGPHQYKPLQIVGLGPIYQLQVLHALDLMLVITGKERLFSCVGLKDLENRLRQSQMGSTISAITSSQIERVKSCHLFACSKVKITYLYIFAAQYFLLPYIC